MGLERHRLTAIAIRARDGVLQDGAGLMLHKAGAAGKWIFRYSFAGRRRDMGLGPWPEVSLAQARRARDDAAALIRGGRDPISERQRHRDAELAAMRRIDPTLAEMVEETFDAKRSGLRGDGDRGRWLSPLTTHVLPKLGKRRISTVTQGDLRDVLKPIWATKPATAEKAVQRLRMVFERARIEGHDADPLTVDRAVHLLGPLRRRITHIAATPWQEIPALWRRLDGSGSSQTCLRWIILTAVRGTPARGARVSEIDLGQQIWTVPGARMKGREGQVADFRVPLSSAAMAMAVELIEFAEDGLLFPSYRRGKSITDAALARALTAIGETGRPHGFRTSFRSWVQDTDAAAFDVAETALAHRIGGRVERSYARSDLLELRRPLMEAWGNFVTGQGALAALD